MPYGMEYLPGQEEENEYTTPISSYPGGTRRMGQMASMSPSPSSAPQQQSGEPDWKGTLGMSKGEMIGGSLATLGAAIAAAIAGPESGVGNLLKGGVEGYTADRSRRMLEKHRQNSKQHEALISVVMDKVPKLSSMAPDHPGVKEIQQMYADALANDKVISPKEAADMSAKIHAIEGEVGVIGEKSAAERKAQMEMQAKQDQQDRGTFKLLQASHPNLQGIKYEEAKGMPWFRKAMDQYQGARAQMADDASTAAQKVVPVDAGGIAGYVPFKDQFEKNAAQQRADTMAGAQNTRAANTISAGAEKTKFQEATELKAQMDKDPYQRHKREIKPGVPNKFFDEGSEGLYNMTMQVIQGQLRMGGPPQVGGAPPPPGLMGIQPMTSRTPLAPPPMPQPVSTRQPLAVGRPSGRPLPSSIDPSQLSEEQKALLRSKGFAI